MTLSIQIPSDAHFHRTALGDKSAFGDNSGTDNRTDSVWQTFCDQLDHCETRDVLFYDEKFTGYIIHETTEDREALPKSVFLDQVSRFDLAPEIGIHNPEVAKGPGLNSRKIRQKQQVSKDGSDNGVNNTTVAVTDLLWQGQHGSVNVSIWRFNSSIRCPPRETSGYIELNVSLDDPSSQDESSGETISGQREEKEKVDNKRHFEHTENLLEELNHGVLNVAGSKTYELFYGGRKEKNGVHGSHRQSIDATKGTEKSDTTVTRNGSKLLKSNQNDTERPKLTRSPGDAFTLRVQISAALQLKLRTTKPGGRNDLFFTSLQIEAPGPLLVSARQPFPRNDVRYAYHILGLEASFKGGRISQLGECSFPRRYEIGNSLNIAFRLEIEQNPDKTEGPVPAASNPVNIGLRVQIEKTEAGTNISSGGSKWASVTQEISTAWAPVLDFDSGYLAPVFPIRSRTPQMSQSQFRSKSAHLKPPPPNGTAVKKSVSIKNSVSSSSLSTGSNGLNSPFSPYHHKQAWPSAVSPNPLRPATPNRSSPSLSVSRSAASKIRTPKIVLSKPGFTSGLTVNLAGDAGSALSGLRLTFSGNPKVELGEVTTWTVKAVNQTSRTLKLALMANHSKRYVSNFPTPYSTSTAALSASYSTLQSVDRARKGPGIQNKLQLYEQYNLAKLEKTGVVLLSNDVSLGVLEPNQVFESEFQFVAFSKGIFSLAGLRVAESTTGETADVGKLLEVYVF